MRIFLLYFPIILVKFACLKLSSLINENKTTVDEINDSQQIEQNETKCEAKKKKLENELTEVSRKTNAERFRRFDDLLSSLSRK